MPSTTPIYIGNRVKNIVFILNIVPKYIQSQVILNDVYYHKYHHHDWQTPCLNVAETRRRKPSSILDLFQGRVEACKYAWSFSALQIHFVQGHPFSPFPFSRSFPHCR